MKEHEMYKTEDTGKIVNLNSTIFRMKTPDGWIVIFEKNYFISCCYVPDLNHEWKLPE